MNNYSISDLIGNTPLVKIKRIFHKRHNVFAKLEYFNPGGSIKDRIALNMINKAEEQGLLSPGGTIVEPTSGNTGIGLSMICAERGYKIILTMPDTMSVERRKILEVYGAKIVLTQGSNGMKGAIDEASKIALQSPDIFMPMQFNNPANPDIHRKTTANEIWDQTNGKVDIFVCGVGTGGTITGVGEVLKQKRLDILVFAVEPSDSAVLSGGSAGAHKIQGIGAGFIPEILNTEIIDRVITVSNEESFEYSKRLGQTEGISAGISSGAAIAAISKIIDEFPDKNIVTVFPDSAERYLSII